MNIVQYVNIYIYIYSIVNSNNNFRMLTFFVMSRNCLFFWAIGGTQWIYLSHCTFQIRGGRFKSPVLGVLLEKFNRKTMGFHHQKPTSTWVALKTMFFDIKTLLF